MCTSIISNRNKTIVGWNLDLLNMKYKVIAEDEMVYIAIYNQKEGWIPLFGANNRGDFVAMPTCWPFDERSNPQTEDQQNIIMLDIDLLMQNKTLDEIRDCVAKKNICSVVGNTFMAQLSDHNGNILQVVPGQGYQYKIRPMYSVLTNFSPFKRNAEQHPLMGRERYNTAVKKLETASDHFDVKECFDLLKEVSQTVCPTVVSTVFDVTENTVYWCENCNWNNISKKIMITK